MRYASDLINTDASLARMDHAIEALQAAANLAQGLRVVGEMAAYYDSATTRSPDTQIAFHLIAEVAHMVGRLTGDAEHALEGLAREASHG